MTRTALHMAHGEEDQGIGPSTLTVRVFLRRRKRIEKGSTGQQVNKQRLFPLTMGICIE
jgi:hypothetical protein